MKHALATARPPTIGTNNIVEGDLIKLIRESESTNARTNHIFKVKVERAKFLLFRRAQLLKKIADIDSELACMVTEDMPRK